MSTSKSIFHMESILGIDAQVSINVYKYGLRTPLGLRALPEPEHGIWSSMPELALTSPYLRVVS
jgi:hypothetical protein